ncbi:hypothetical protein A2U01_0003849, partial [Trifolium medium]|nr:hypothetical protein [Trifolium medium]
MKYVNNIALTLQFKGSLQPFLRDLSLRLPHIQTFIVRCIQAWWWCDERRLPSAPPLSGSVSVFLWRFHGRCYTVYPLALGSMGSNLVTLRVLAVPPLFRVLVWPELCQSLFDGACGSLVIGGVEMGWWWWLEVMRWWILFESLMVSKSVEICRFLCIWLTSTASVLTVW